MQLGDQLGIVDLEQQLASGDVVAALHWPLTNPAVDTRCDVDARRVGLALNNKRLRLHEVPKRQADNCADNDRNDNGGSSRDPRRSPRLSGEPLFHRRRCGPDVFGLAIFRHDPHADWLCEKSTLTQSYSNTVGFHCLLTLVSIATRL